ncbi:CDGSH iron-sulfur domain-containing protein [Flavobacteriaceae bacterium]|nr:CDGSH iron-sulfur domain-containing protein [Flavobacteriaceae bacterium]
MKPPIPTPRACYLLKNKVYSYCTCNNSKDLPYCDKTQKCCKPLLFKVPENEKAFLCTCGATKEAPYCDGSH